MTERMQDYRQKMEEKGYVQIRIWVKKQDEKFIKFIGQFCRRGQTKREKKRYGRRATDKQIDFAQSIAIANNVSEPTHLYNYHISLAAWIWRYKGGK